jgi:hypothetical protein
MNFFITLRFATIGGSVVNIAYDLVNIVAVGPTSSGDKDLDIQVFDSFHRKITTSTIWSKRLV